MADDTSTDSSWWDTFTGWFGGGDDSSGGSTSGLAWNPDKGWVDSAGNVIYSGADATSGNLDSGVINEKAMTLGIDPSAPNVGGLVGLAESLGGSLWGGLKKAFTDKEGNVNWGNIAALGGGLYGALKAGANNKPVGYQGNIPSYTMVRSQVPTYDPNRQPGSSGQTYFTPAQYVSGDTAAAKETAAKQAEDLAAANRANPAAVTKNPAWGYANGGIINPNTIDVGDDTLPYTYQNFAQGGIANLAGGKYLAGNTDGMADKIPATIADKQPAKLSHGEFVIPADVVSHLGNGNSEAGADRLYSMMDKIRQARTGTKKQGKQINPNKFLPG
jgi:hypothetical protein